MMQSLKEIMAHIIKDEEKIEEKAQFNYEEA